MACSSGSQWFLLKKLIDPFMIPLPFLILSGDSVMTEAQKGPTNFVDYKNRKYTEECKLIRLKEHHLATLGLLNDTSARQIISIN